MGSPCNEFGNDPENDGQRSDNCDDAGEFWANVGSPNATKRSGDAFQNNVCTSGDDGCSGSTNTDYDGNGYVYTVTLSRSVSDLKIQLFDPAQVVVGDHCTQNLTGASGLTSAQAPPGSNPAVRYAQERRTVVHGRHCDQRWVRAHQDEVPGARGRGINAWDPLGWPVRAGCDRTFEPFSGDLSKALDHTSGATYHARRRCELSAVGDPVLHPRDSRTGDVRHPGQHQRSGHGLPRRAQPLRHPGHRVRGHRQGRHLGRRVQQDGHVREHPQWHVEVLPRPRAQRSAGSAPRRPPVRHRGRRDVRQHDQRDRTAGLRHAPSPGASAPACRTEPSAVARSPSAARTTAGGRRSPCRSLRPITATTPRRPAAGCG